MADRLSALPNELLSLILSKLPIADAIGSSILSKRWRFLSTEMPQLVLFLALLTPTPQTFPPLNGGDGNQNIPHITVAFVGSGRLFTLH